MDAVVAFIANGEAITMWLRIVATVALQDVGPSAASPRTATGFGSNGSRRVHSASSTRGCAMRDRTKSTAQAQEISRRF